MKVRYWMFLVVFTLTISTAAFAGSTCALATLVEADGSIKDFDFAAPSTSVYYQFGVTTGHSYSVKVVQDYDDKDTDITVAVNNEASTCNVAVPSVTVTTNAEPILSVNGFRESFTAAASGTYSIVVSNSNGAAGRYIAVSVSDTTMYNVRWSTFGGFVTQWGFQNTTNQPISVKFSVTASAGGAFSGSNGPFVIPANSQVFRAIGTSGQDINTVNPYAGFMVESNDGPPGGLLVDAFFVNGSVIVPAVFQPVRSLQH